MDISPSEYNDFRQVLERQSGILLGDNKQYLVASRLSNFLKENQLSSILESATLDLLFEQRF